jgi:hypothetical protein
VDSDNDRHIRFTVFQDRANCGHLTFEREAYFQFEKALVENNQFPVTIESRAL